MSETPINPDPDDVLLVIDVQNDFCPGGGLAVLDGDAVVPVINRLAAEFADSSAHVVLTQDWHPAGHSSFASTHGGAAPFSMVEMAYGPQTLWPDHCVQDTRGAQFHASLEIPHAEMIVRKGFRHDIDSYSAFFENDQVTPTGLAGYLRERGVKKIFCVGLATDFCVAFTALDAARLGFDTVVIRRACRAIDLDGSLAAALGKMDDAGVELL